MRRATFGNQSKTSDTAIQNELAGHIWHPDQMCHTPDLDKIQASWV